MSPPTVVGIAEADCTVDAPAGGKLCASNEFGSENGFSFANWAGNEYAGDSFKVEEFISLFSPEKVCAEWDGSNCTLEPSAQQSLDEFDALIKNGRCEGMVVLSERIRSGAIPLKSIGAQAKATSELSPKEPLLLNLINYWWASQFSTKTIEATASFRTLKPSQILSQIKAGLDSGLGYSLGIYSGGSGHAILPVTIRSIGEGIFYIDAYDSNAVGKLRTLKVDTTKELWTYKFGSRNSSESTKEWSGGAGSMDLTPMSSREGTLECDDCLQGRAKGSAPTKVTVNPDGSDDSVSLRVVTGPGKEVNVVDGVVTKNSNDAVVQLHRNGAGGGFTLLVNEDESDLVVNLSVSDTETLRSGGAFADSFTGDSGAGALLSVSRAGRPRVQMSTVSEAAKGSTSGGLAVVDLTLENQSDLVTVNSESGASANLSVASQQQLVSVKIEDGQTASLERVETTNGGSESINVDVKEGETSLYASTVVDTGRVTSTEVVMNGKIATSTNKVFKNIELDSARLATLNDTTKSVQYAAGELTKQPANEQAVDSSKDGVFTQGPTLFESPPGSGKYDIRWVWQGAEAVITASVTNSSGDSYGVGNGLSATGGLWGPGLSLPAGSYVVKLVASNGQSSTYVASIKANTSSTTVATSIQPGVFTQVPSVFESPPGSGKFDVRWGWSGAEASISVSVRGPDGGSVGSASGVNAKGGYWGPGLSLAAGNYTVKLVATNGETISAVSVVKVNPSKNTTTLPESMTSTTAAPGAFASAPIFYEFPAGSGKYDVRWTWSGGNETLQATLLNADGKAITSAVLSAESNIWPLGMSLAPGNYSVNLRASRGASVLTSLIISAPSPTTTVRTTTTTTTTTTQPIVPSTTTTTLGPGAFSGAVTLTESPVGSGKYDVIWQWVGAESTVTGLVRNLVLGFEQSRSGLSASSGRWGSGFSLSRGRTYVVTVTASNGESVSANVSIP